MIGCNVMEYLFLFQSEKINISKLFFTQNVFKHFIKTIILKKYQVKLYLKQFSRIFESFSFDVRLYNSISYTLEALF